MAHKVNIGGTAYEIDGGRTLVNGTGYSIDKGKSMVGGTVYEVGFKGEPVRITLSAAYVKSVGDASVTINGVKYSASTHAGQTIKIDAFVGDTITCSAAGISNGAVFVNDKSTPIVSAQYGVTYEYVITGHTTIHLSTMGMAPNYGSGMVYITECGLQDSITVYASAGDMDEDASFVLPNGTIFVEFYSIASNAYDEFDEFWWRKSGGEWWGELGDGAEDALAILRSGTHLTPIYDYTALQDGDYIFAWH